MDMAERIAPDVMEVHLHTGETLVEVYYSETGIVVRHGLLGQEPWFFPAGSTRPCFLEWAANRAAQIVDWSPEACMVDASC